MITLPFYQGKTVAVLGLGRTGLSIVRSLEASGATVLAWDDNENAVGQAAAEGVDVAAVHAKDWQRLSALFVSPGVPWEKHPWRRHAEAAKVPVLGDFDLLYRACPDATYIGITGTNGKSTTSALVAHILAEAGQPVQLGGNIGKPVLELEPADESGVYVIEASSYQLQLAELIRFRYAAFINISADHLDRHGTMEAYVAAKKRIFRHQSLGDTAVIGIDHSYTRRVFEEFKEANAEQTLIPVSVLDKLKQGVYCDGPVLMDAIDGGAEEAMDMTLAERLPGIHNWQNGAVAYALMRSFGLEAEQIIAAMQTFKGLEHRQEQIAVHRGVRYINDSKATNGDAAARALACYSKIYWILGGQPKEGGIDMLQPYFPKIIQAYGIGDAAEAFGETCRAAGVPYTISGDLQTAVQQAHAAAQRDLLDDAVVLLSPACASFDQYSSFVERGDHFRRLVKECLKQDNQQAESGG